MTTAPTRARARFACARTDAPTADVERERLLAAPGFGTVFTDHMARITWTSDGGWSGHRVEARAPLQLDPAAAVLHYGQEIFEGLKAYRHDDGSVWAFRPHANAARFQVSARRMALPELPTEDFVGSIEALVDVDSAWVPGDGGSSLYLRPFMFASEAFLGVRAARVIDYLVIASPAGSYFAGGVRAVSIWVAEDLRRAGPGGTGAAKCGGNYAASLASQQRAYAQGCDQVCFLDAATGRNLEELGGMNVFVVHADGTVRTPRLTGTLLPGVVRDSAITVLTDAGHEVREEDVALTDVLTGVRDGSVTEVFACGTGAAVTPIGRLVGESFDEQVGGGRIGPATAALRSTLTDIQHGRAEDRYGWMHRLV